VSSEYATRVLGLDVNVTVSSQSRDKPHVLTTPGCSQMKEGLSPLTAEAPGMDAARAAEL